jgi:hypothetical protein
MKKRGWWPWIAAGLMVGLMLVGLEFRFSGGAESAVTLKTPAEATADCGGANTSVQPSGWPQPGAPFQTCEQYSSTELLIKLANPKAGATYDYAADGNGGWITPGDQIVVPTGYCYRIEHLVVHLTTSGATTARNIKIAVRDSLDPDPPGGGNRGLWMGPGANGILAYDYADTQFAPNGLQTNQTFAAGTSGNLKSYNVSGWIPDICVQPRTTIGIDTKGMQPGDTESELSAIVQWTPQP